MEKHAYDISLSLEKLSRMTGALYDFRWVSAICLCHLSFAAGTEKFPRPC